MLGVRARDIAWATEERMFMKRVAIGELPQRLRNCVADQLTENTGRLPLRVLAFACTFARFYSGRFWKRETKSALTTPGRSASGWQGRCERETLSFSLSSGAYQLTAALPSRCDRNLPAFTHEHLTSLPWHVTATLCGGVTNSYFLSGRQFRVGVPSPQ
jgi:hypothetical protein